MLQEGPDRSFLGAGLSVLAAECYRAEKGGK